MFNREARAAGRVDMLISASAKIHGDVDFTGGLHIEGHVLGAVRAYGPGESSVSVGEGGVIDRGVMATHVVVNGIVRGDVRPPARWRSGPAPRCWAMSSTAPSNRPPVPRSRATCCTVKPATA